MTFAGPSWKKPRPFYEGVVVVDPATGQPVNFSSSGGDATAANQTTQINILNSIAANTAKTASLINRSGTTSSTPSTYSQIAAANTGRKGFFFQNISDAPIEIGVGDPSSEFTIAVVPPNGSFSFWAVVSPQRIVARCSAASKAFIAVEA